MVLALPGQMKEMSLTQAYYLINLSQRNADDQQSLPMQSKPMATLIAR